MGQHSKIPGRVTIAALNEIGRILKYNSRNEWPIPGTGSHPQAIDVCWFFDNAESSPLFAFEVESTDSAAAQGNANKLFAKPVQQLQKPLFFFHLFLDGPDNNTRKSDLLSLYGKYNYNVYDLKKTTISPLVYDILGQHRRLSDRLRVYEFCQYLATHPEFKIDADELIDAIFNLGFEVGRGSLLQQLGLLVINEIDVRESVSKELDRRFDAPRKSEFENYESWLGNYYQEAVHLAMIAHLDPSRRPEVVEKIRKWQLGEYIGMMAPDLGRDLDYDHFILCWSASFWGLLIGLVGDSPEFRRYACDQIKRVCDDASTTRYSRFLPFTGLWLLLISIHDPLLIEFSDLGRQIIKDGGGVPEHYWHNPPATFMLDGEFPIGFPADFGDEPRLDISKTNAELIDSFPCRESETDLQMLSCGFEVLIDVHGLDGHGLQIATGLKKSAV